METVNSLVSSFLYRLQLVIRSNSDCINNGLHTSIHGNIPFPQAPQSIKIYPRDFLIITEYHDALDDVSPDLKVVPFTASFASYTKPIWTPDLLKQFELLNRIPGLYHRWKRIGQDMVISPVYLKRKFQNRKEKFQECQTKKKKNGTKLPKHYEFQRSRGKRIPFVLPQINSPTDLSTTKNRTNPETIPAPSIAPLPAIFDHDDVQINNPQQLTRPPVALQEPQGPSPGMPDWMRNIDHLEDEV